MTFSRRFIVAFALLSSVMVVTMTPGTVLAASGLAVGSNHTTFGTGGGESSPQTLSNLKVTGSGDGASVGLVENVVNYGIDDGDLTEYTGDTDLWSVVSSPTYTGSASVQADTSSVDKPEIISTGEAIDYPEQGDTITYWTRAAGSDDGSRLLFGVQNSGNLYSTRVNWAGGNIQLLKRDGGSEKGIEQTPVNIQTDTWYKVAVDWQSDGDIVMTLFDAGGTQLAQISASDSEYASGGVGFRATRGNVVINPVTSPQDGRYLSAVHSVDGAEEAVINVDQLSNVEVSATIRTAGGTVLGETTFTSAGKHTVALSETSASSIVTELDLDATGVSPAFKLSEESILFSARAPEFDANSITPANNTTTTAADVEFSVNVTDSDFGTAQGDTITGEVVLDGKVVGSATTSSNGTLTVTGEVAGSGEWHLRLTDAYGNTVTTESRSITTPSTIFVRYESEPSTLVDDVTLDVRFFGENDTTVQRTVTDGTVSLAGLPVGERFVVTASGPDVYYRRIVINSIYESENIYLLNSSKESSRIVFALDDPTGQFPPEETYLYIEKPIEVDGETQYRTIAGDRFGATGRFPAILQQDSRYRLRVSTDSESSSSRILGAYSVYGATTETLQIERIEPASNSGGGAVYGSLDGSGTTRQLAVRYTETGNDSIESVEYRVLYQNGSVFVPTTTDSSDSFAHIYPLPMNVSESVSFEIEYTLVLESGETTSGSVHVGSLGGLADRFNVDAQVLSIVSWIAILSTMGLLVIVNHKLAPVGGVGMATALTIIDTVAIPMAMLGIAGAIAVFVLIGGDS